MTISISNHGVICNNCKSRFYITHYICFLCDGCFVSYTPINQANLKKEGREVYSYLSKLLYHSFYRSGEKRNIYLKRYQFDLLFDTLSAHEKKYYKTKIPFFGHEIVRAGN